MCCCSTALSAPPQIIAQEQRSHSSQVNRPPLHFFCPYLPPAHSGLPECLWQGLSKLTPVQNWILQDSWFSGLSHQVNKYGQVIWRGKKCMLTMFFLLIWISSAASQKLRSHRLCVTSQVTYHWMWLRYDQLTVNSTIYSCINYYYCVNLYSISLCV